MSAHPGRLPLRLVDHALLAYLLFASVIALARLPDRPLAGWVVAANGLIAVLVFLLRSPTAGRLGWWVRELYPILILPALYGGLDLLNGPGVRIWDTTVRGWEEALFGGQVSREWWLAAPSRFWSTLFHATYFSYYLIIPFPVVYFLARGRPDAARRAMTLVVVTFLLCYLCFLLFPVAGPYYEFPRPEGAFVDNWAARLVYATLAGGSSYGAAFPSSHVAATVAAALGTWMGSRRLGGLLFVPTGLLTVGVVYCQMHYAVDAVAGFVLPFAVAWTVLRLEARRRVPVPLPAPG